MSYTDKGHQGVISGQAIKGNITRDTPVKQLAKEQVSQARKAPGF